MPAPCSLGASRFRQGVRRSRARLAVYAGIADDAVGSIGARARQRQDWVATEYYYVERVYFDGELAEVDTGRPGWRYTLDGGESYMGYREFLAFLREIGVRPKDLEWEYAGGMNIAGVEYAEIGSEDERTRTRTRTRRRRRRRQHGSS